MNDLPDVVHFLPVGPSVKECLEGIECNFLAIFVLWFSYITDNF